jgi:hypothetical protein
MSKIEACNSLREFIAPGGTVYTRLNHRARSGMMRVIDLFVIQDNEPRRITWTVCQALGKTYNRKHEGLKMSGCGMDMGFYAVYRLGHALWPNGTRNGEAESDGGYALKQRWL